MKVAIFLMGFPGASEPWIVNHITGLINYGLDVDIYVNSSNEGYPGAVSSEALQYNLLSRAKFLKYKARNRLFEYCIGGYLFFKNLKRYPSPLIRSLNFIKYGKESWSSRLLFTALNFMGMPKYDLVHCHFGPAGVLASTLKELGLINCPIVTTFHGYDINVYPNKVKNNNYSRLFSNGGEYTAVSGFALHKLIKLGANPNKTFVWPMGVNLDKFSYASRKFEDIVNTNEIFILTVARLETVKGIQYAIEAIDLARKSFPDIKYYIVGEGRERNHLECLVSRRKLEENVYFLGAVKHSKIASFYAKSHVFLLPSVVDDDGAEEALPVVLLEAQACGLPIIASRVGGIPEALNEGETGMLVSPNDSGEIARALCSLLRKPDVMEKISLLGRKHVESKYSLKNLNTFIINKYEQLINSPML